MYTRQEYTAICAHCEHRKFDRKQGIICSLTNAPAAFEEECPDFIRDKRVNMDRRQVLEEKAKKEQEYTTSKAIVDSLLSIAGVLMIATTDLTLMSLLVIAFSFYRLLSGFDSLPQKKKNLNENDNSKGMTL